MQDMRGEEEGKVEAEQGEILRTSYSGERRERVVRMGMLECASMILPLRPSAPLT